MSSYLTWKEERLQFIYILKFYQIILIIDLETMVMKFLFKDPKVYPETFF